MSRILPLIALVLAALFALAGAGRVEAQGLLERLVMPGPTIEGHANVEGQCSKCHEPLSTSAQPRLCMSCHEEIAADREKGRGYHGKHSEASNRECRACHTEHKGRTADISSLDRERFDHELSDFPLTGGHRRTDCANCHVPRKPFHKTASDCVSCHSRVDPHQGRLGTQCDACHSTSAWRSVRPFDHDRTKFPLNGAHGKVACTTCHAGEVYKDLWRDCIACHRIQDVHAQLYGPKCETCHNDVAWKPARFDHSATKFPLRGAHSEVKCDACHTGDLYKDRLSTTCASCHKDQDPHLGKLGPQCDTCHNERDWRREIRFDHNRTRFPLTGQHVQALCESCHTTRAFRGAPVQCEKCHEDTFHKGRLGATAQCGACHNAQSWRDWKYDHARMTRFPLTGAHQRVACESCHRAPSPPSLKLPMACQSCHKDYHDGRLGAALACGTCHNTTAWSQWRFNHGQKTGFALIGAHARLRCESCHVVRNAPSLKVASDCASCHRREDAHIGAFGRACERCHTPAGWRQVSIRR